MRQSDPFQSKSNSRKQYACLIGEMWRQLAKHSSIAERAAI